MSLLLFCLAPAAFLSPPSRAASSGPSEDPTSRGAGAAGGDVYVDGLAGSWPLDDGEGATAADASGGGNHGRLKGDPAWTADGRVRGALTFDKVDDVVVIEPAGYDFSAWEGITVAAWVKHATGRPGKNDIVTFWSWPKGRSFLLTHHDTGGYHWEIGSTYMDGGRVSRNWTHVAASYDVAAGMMRLYVNGEETASKDLPGKRRLQKVAADLMIGGQSNPGNECNFQGTIDEVFLFDRALRLREVRWLFEGRVCPPGTYGGLDWREIVELKTVAAHLARGQLGRAWTSAERHLKGADEKKAAEGRRVIEALTAHAEGWRAELVRLKPEGPAYAVEKLAELGRRLQPAKIGRKLASEARAWRKDPAVRKAIQADAIFAAVKKAASSLEGKDASDPRVQRSNLAAIRTVIQGVRKLRRDHPDSARTREALDLARRLSIPLPD